MKKKWEFLNRYRYVLCLGILFGLAFLLRVYKIGEIPDILQLDEAGMGYNAWGLANYGVDRYLNEMPIYPQNHNGGQSPLYTYTLVLLCKIFSVQNMSVAFVRIPALLSGMLTVICGAKMLKLAFDDEKLTLAGTALFAICPVFVMQGRFALDCNMMISTSVLAITLLLGYLKCPTWRKFIGCGIGFSIVLYSYALSYMILPVFLIGISLYMLYTKRLTVGKTFALAGTIIVLSMPVILFVICLLFKLPGFKFMGFHILPIAAERMEDVAVTGFWHNFVDGIKISLTHSFYILDAVDKFYTMYVVSIPFIVIGFGRAVAAFIKSLRTREFTVDAVFLFFAIAVSVTIGFAGTGYVYRANAVFLCYVYFAIKGIQTILSFLKRNGKVFALVLCVTYALWTASFVKYYFAGYSVSDFTYPNSLYFIPEKEVLAQGVEDANCEKVYVDAHFDEYIYFFYPINPYEKEQQSNSADGNRYCAVVNYDTPIESGAVYIVHKGNWEFLEKLQISEVAYEIQEYKHYYLIDAH